VVARGCVSITPRAREQWREIRAGHPAHNLKSYSFIARPADTEPLKLPCSIGRSGKGSGMW
jgi:hypothetical protein